MNQSPNYQSLRDVLAGLSGPDISNYVSLIERHIRKDLAVNQNALYSLLSLPLYSQWRIGIADDLNARLTQHRADGYGLIDLGWLHVSLSEAREIERHFVNLHMQGGVGGQSKGPNTYVYVFRA